MHPRRLKTSKTGLSEFLLGIRIFWGLRQPPHLEGQTKSPAVQDTSGPVQWGHDAQLKRGCLWGRPALVLAGALLAK